MDLSIPRLSHRLSRTGVKLLRENLRKFALICGFLLLPACKDRALEERADQIRQYSDREDRLYTTQAIRQIERQFWTLRDHVWMGKLPDGALIRLDAPRAAAAPLPSRAFYSGWHLQLTVSSEDWRTDPPSDHSEPFQAVYAITRHGPTNWDIEVTRGPATAPLHREDILRLEGTATSPPSPNPSNLTVKFGENMGGLCRFAPL